MRIRENSHHDKMAVAWACGVLRLHGVHFESVAEHRNAWDILTAQGWMGVNSVAELCEVARDIQRGLLTRAVPA